MTTKLTEIAAEMKAATLDKGHAYRWLKRGLHLSLLIRGGQWYLTLARRDVYPSDAEAELCLKAFEADGWYTVENEETGWCRRFYEWSAFPQNTIGLDTDQPRQSESYYCE